LDRVHGELVNLQSTIAEARGAVASFKDRFVRFRSTSEGTFERVWGMAVVTIGVVIALAIFEYKNLKGFLLKMKLVSKKREREEGLFLYRFIWVSADTVIGRRWANRRQGYKKAKRCNLDYISEVINS